MWWPLCLPGNAISLQSALGSEGRHGGCYSSKQFGSSCFRIQQRLYQFFSFLDFCGVLFCLVLPLTCVLLFFHPALLKKDPKNESVLQVRPWEDPENMVMFQIQGTVSSSLRKAFQCLSLSGCQTEFTGTGCLSVQCHADSSFQARQRHASAIHRADISHTFSISSLSGTRTSISPDISALSSRIQDR